MATPQEKPRFDIQAVANAIALADEAKYGPLPSPSFRSPQSDPPPSSDIPLTTFDSMELARGFYDRLTNVLASAGITKQYLENVVDQKFPFNFIGMEGQLFIDMSTANTLRLIRTAPQNGGYLQEQFDVCVDGRASYKSKTFVVKDQQEFTVPLDGCISQTEQKNTKTVIDRLRALTDNLEASLASPAYSPHMIKQQVGALYQILIRDCLMPQRIIRSREESKSDDHQAFLPVLGEVVLNFIRNRGKNGILLIKRRPDGTPIKKWFLFETGNAGVLIYQQTGDGNNPVWYGRIHIERIDGKEHNHSSNPYLTYLEFQRVATEIASRTSHDITSS